MTTRANGRTVWDADHGWHDGADVTVALDDHGRMVAEPITAETEAEAYATHVDAWCEALAMAEAGL